MVHVVLVHPEIPPNTGNVGRLCLAVGATLHLIRPLGFRLDDTSLKRAGLDYWKRVELVVWESLEAYLSAVDSRQFVLTGSHRGQPYHCVEYRRGDHILFGAETSGLPLRLFERFPDRIAKIPINHGEVRSLNLSTAVGVIVFEALRQTGGLPGSE